MNLTDKGVAFLVAHEGFVSRAYKDPVGIVTIGTGFTMRSKVARAYWKKTRGRELRLGDTITRQENDALLQRAVAAEYGPPVVKIMPPAAMPWHFDGACSVSFNCGPGSTSWTWAKFLAQGKIAQAAERLKGTAITARGRVLPGLVRRRKEEAELILRGHYGAIKLPSSTGRAPDAPSRESIALCADYAKRLDRLGFKVSAEDGLWKVKVSAAVKAYQVKHPDLVNDGVLGKATMAQIDRDILALEDTEKGATVGGGAIIVGVPAAYSLWDRIQMLGPIIIGGVVLCVVAWLLWRNWPEFKRWAQDGDYVGQEYEPSSKSDGVVLQEVIE